MFWNLSQRMQHVCQRLLGQGQAAIGPNRLNSSHWPTKENRQKLRFFCIFPENTKKLQLFLYFRLIFSRFSKKIRKKQSFFFGVCLGEVPEFLWVGVVVWGGVVQSTLGLYLFWCFCGEGLVLSLFGCVVLWGLTVSLRGVFGCVSGWLGWVWLVGLLTEMLKKFQGLAQITAFLHT